MKLPFWYYELKHRLTCWWCFPGIITGMNRNKRGRGALDVAVLAIIILIGVIICGFILGYALRGG